uniref:Chitin deacetylase n=1 Tax=Flammulina velutipes TaxID=38945 RepID=Q1XGD4_FLAVE|nr:chitin deacetylase [Flammulina velutipes]
MLFSAIALSVLACVATVEAAPTNEKRQQAQVIYGCTQPNTVALTFDDGPYWYIYDISNALTSRGAKGTFFFSGNNYQRIYDQGAIDQIKYAYNAGHQVASHTWGHKDLTSLTWDQIHDEMWRVELALQRIVGVQPAFMRPPYGNYDDEVLYASYIRGQKVVIWDFDSGDSVGASAAESKERYRTTSLNRPSTLLALNHETIESTAHDVIPYAIDRLQSAGYRLVTVAECLGEQPYQWTGAPQTPTSDWRC